MTGICSLIPKDKFDNSNIEKLKQLNIKPIPPAIKRIAERPA